MELILFLLRLYSMPNTAPTVGGVHISVPHRTKNLVGGQGSEYKLAYHIFSVTLCMKMCTSTESVILFSNICPEEVSGICGNI